MRVLVAALALVCAPSFTCFADELTRRIQEELRKRNLYFGDVNGLSSPELAGALRRYQQRKGFPVTGAVDQVTAASLHVAPAASATRWPDVPVLRSDAARELPPQERIAIERKAETAPEPSPSPPIPGEAPDARQNLDPARVRALVQQYLADAETDDVSRQVAYYDFPVDYFDHGRVGREFVERDARNYVKRWPERHYMLVNDPVFAAGGDAGETVVEFTIAFRVQNRNHAVTGKTRNFWAIKPSGDDLKIVAIREERLRE